MTKKLGGRVWKLNLGFIMGHFDFQCDLVLWINAVLV